MKHVLTAICCFSRFVWLIPIPDTTAETIGKALLENVLLGMGMFPAVLRSDRALSFTGSVLAYINQQLEIKHVLGSSYHPQSQGMVERMHRTLKIIGRAVVQENPNNWPTMMPYAQCVLRVIPLKSLGGRSPYEVVTGLRPKLPIALLTKFPVQEISVDTYAERLVGYVKSMWGRIKALAEDVAGNREESAPGSMKRELSVGDLVLRKLSPNAMKTHASGAPLRWARTVDPVVYRVVSLVNNQPGAVRLVDHGDPTRALAGFVQPINKDFLIRLDMPELEPGLPGPRRIEI